MKMDFAEVLAQLPSEYHYLALQQGNSAVASWLKLNGVAGDKIFNVMPKLNVIPECHAMSECDR